MCFIYDIIRIIRCQYVIISFCKTHFYALLGGEMVTKDYYDLLLRQFNSKEDIITERINLEAILQLPKGTEHYISDIHGEYEAFTHILRNGAGIIREKILFLFPEKDSIYKEQLELFIYYPESFLTDRGPFDSEWYRTKLDELTILIKEVAGKYSRSKLRKALPKKFAYLAEELIFRTEIQDLKQSYYLTITEMLAQLNQMDLFLIALCESIQRLVVDHLHIVGDIFDRGKDADKVLDEIMQHHNVDIQWGNHDVLWLGAMSGNTTCLVSLLRIATRYNYLEDLEKSYAINLRQLFIFAEKNYQENKSFYPKDCSDADKNVQFSKIHQALTVLQLKLEGQLAQRQPEFELTNPQYLKALYPNKQSIQMDEYKIDLNNSCFQTVDVTNPYQLTIEESLVIETLLDSFQNSHRLKKHLDFVLNKGSMYLVYNDQLLFHGCIPLSNEGMLKNVTLNGKTFCGKELLDYFDVNLRESYRQPDVTNDFTTDLYWYAWCGKYSPLFGKEKMATFERYFIDDKKLQKERKNGYFSFRDDPEICKIILNDFGLTGDNSHIINGHTPVKTTKGEKPIKADGKVFVIDGGLSKAYQKTTGIGGYTLLYSSTGFQLVTHYPFCSIAVLLDQYAASVSTKRVIDKQEQRILIRDTTIGKILKRQIHDLDYLLKNEIFNLKKEGDKRR